MAAATTTTTKAAAGAAPAAPAPATSTKAAAAPAAAPAAATAPAKTEAPQVPVVILDVAPDAAPPAPKEPEAPAEASIWPFRAEIANNSGVPLTVLPSGLLISPASSAHLVLKDREHAERIRAEVVASAVDQYLTPHIEFVSFPPAHQE